MPAAALMRLRKSQQLPGASNQPTERLSDLAFLLEDAGYNRFGEAVDVCVVNFRDKTAAAINYLSFGGIADINIMGTVIAP
jgi:hypothetical protein